MRPHKSPAHRTKRVPLLILSPLTAFERANLPLDKIRANLKKLENSSNFPQQLGVLFQSGTYNPLHLMHTHMFDVVRDKLQENGVHILGGWLAPSNDHYASNKLGEEHMEAAKRFLVVL